MNKEPIKLSDSETIKQLKSLPSDIRSARNSMSDLVGSATDLFERVKSISSELKGQKTPMSDIRTAFRNITSDAQKLRNDEAEIEKLNSKQLKNLQARVKKNSILIREESERLINSKDLTALQKTEMDLIKDTAGQYGEVNDLSQSQKEEILELIQASYAFSDEQKAILSNYYDQNNILDKINEKTAERLKFEKQIDKDVRGFSVLTDLVNAIPGLRQFSGPFKDAETAARNAAENSGNSLDILKAGGEALMKAFGPLTVLLTTFTFLKNITFGVSKDITEIQKSMGISNEEARDFRDQIVDVKSNTNDVVVNTHALLDAQKQVSAAFGVTRGFTKQQLLDQIKLTKRVGLQADSAANIQRLSALSGQSTENSLENIVKQTAALSQQSGIYFDDREILQDISEVNGQIAATLGNNPGRIAAAVVQVRRLGLNLEQARTISSSLLDFQSSIESELEAELLTGKELNLERARALALQGDFAGAAAETAKQVGTLSEFNSMNVLAQQAIAEASGMTVDELADSLAYTENLNKIGQQEKQNLLDKINFLKEQGRVQEANDLAKSLGSKEQRLAALNQIDASTKFNESLERAKSLFADMFKDTEGIGTSIVNTLSTLMTMKPLLAAIAGLYVTMAVRSAAIAVANIFSSAALAGSKRGLIGMGLGLFAAGAFVSSMYGALSRPVTPMNDGVIAPDGGMIVSGDKGSIQLNKDDSIIAGTNLGGGGEGNKELLMEIKALRAAVEKGGNVYMDGNKVGQALVLSSYQSS